MSEQPDLLSWSPPEPYIAHGQTFSLDRDGARLGDQARRVFEAMRDGEWRTLREISAATGDPEASVSARLRGFRDFGFTVEREYIRRGLHKYRVTK